MNVLFILGKDYHNKSTLKIYEECKNRGYTLGVYALFQGTNHIKMFTEKGIQVHSIEELTDDIIKISDFIYGAVPLFGYEMFRKAHKYVFINPTTSYHELYFCNDFSFTARDLKIDIAKGKYWAINEFNKAKIQPCMATGLAHFDGLDELSCKDSNIILFIDAGHFPFGHKKELAQLILEIADICKDYKIRIKPRFIKGDKDATHRNDDYLVDHLMSICDGKLPENVEMIMEHTELRDEIEKAYLVICPEATSSFIEAAIAKRKILIFEGFPNQDNIGWSNKAIKRFVKATEGNGCRVAYQNICDYLPNGLQCEEKFIKKLLYKTSGVTTDIVDAMEYIYVNFISKGLFPKDDYYYSDNYKEVMIVDEEKSWDDVIQRRYRNILMEKVSCDAYLHVDLDFTTVLDAILNTKNIHIDEDNFEIVSHEIDIKIYDLLIENKTVLMENAISQCYLLDALYKRKQFKELPEDRILCKEYYSFVMAKYTAEYGNSPDKILNYLSEYFEGIKDNKFERTLADREYTKGCAYYYKGVAYFQKKDYKEALINFEECENILNNSHKKAKVYIQQINKEIDMV